MDLQQDAMRRPKCWSISNGSASAESARTSAVILTLLGQCTEDEEAGDVVGAGDKAQSSKSANRRQIMAHELRTILEATFTADGQRGTQEDTKQHVNDRFASLRIVALSPARLAPLPKPATPAAPRQLGPTRARP